MSIQDPISDMLTRIRNAQLRGKPSVRMPCSKHKLDILAVMLDEGYISGFQKTGDAIKAEIDVELKYHNGKAVIEEINRVSRPGLRQYKASNEIPDVFGGLGIAILSTNKGVMTGEKAVAQGIGGEVVCTVF